MNGKIKSVNMTGLSAVAIIPARSGSKRIPNKNVKPFFGKPLLSYSIEAARQTGLFNKIIVSTDCENIAKVASDYGADVPFARPAELADDFCPITDVFSHALHYLETQSQKPDFACCIYATAPLISATDIKRGFESLVRKTDFKTALAVSEFAFPIQRALHLSGDLGLTMIQQENRFVRSQDLEKCYHDAGQFFWQRLDQKKVKPNAGYLPVIIDRRRVQDIDTEEDWHYAECMARAFDYIQQEEKHCASF